MNEHERELAEELRNQGFSSTFSFHGAVGMDSDDAAKLLKLIKKNKNADKERIRVTHFDL